MPRTRIDLGTQVEKQIVALMARGGTAASIAASLRADGVAGVSQATIGRRMRELRGEANAARATRAKSAAKKEAKTRPVPPAASPAATRARPDDLPATPDAIPEDADLATIDRWLEIADRNGRVAENEGDMQTLGGMGRLTSMLLERKRKMRPPEKVDPNDSPDMRALAARVGAELHRLIDLAVTP